MDNRRYGRRPLIVGATAFATFATGHTTATDASEQNARPHMDLEERSLDELRAMLEAGTMTSTSLVQMYLERIAAIDHSGPALRSVLEINPDALEIAAERDNEAAAGKRRGPLHGIPVLLKDNIDTADKMHTTAGSLALMDAAPANDATVAAKLREAGAVILGKTNLSEWANFRGAQSSSGWSGRGGQTLNPYQLHRTPSGSSSGSAVAVAANLTAVAIGTETNGSIVSPANVNGCVGIKPTVGLTSRAGVIPISARQDTVGPIARTVADAALVLGAIAGVDARDAATSASEQHAAADYTRYLDKDALRGARIGVAADATMTGFGRQSTQVLERAVDVMRALGAEIVKDVRLPRYDELMAEPGSFLALQYELKRAMNAYLSERKAPGIASLADLIAFNRRHERDELALFGQELFEMSEATSGTDDPEYKKLVERLTRQSRDEGLDKVLKEHRLDALVAPTGSIATVIDPLNGEQFLGGSSSPSAIAGYPIVTVPAGFANGLPCGVSFMGTAWSEGRLISLAYAFEQATMMRRAPQFLPPSIGLLSETVALELPDLPTPATPAAPGSPAASPDA